MGEKNIIPHGDQQKISLQIKSVRYVLFYPFVGTFGPPKLPKDLSSN